MTGTVINIITVLIGGTLGLLFGARLPERLKKTVVAGMGLFTFATLHIEGQMGGNMLPFVRLHLHAVM